MTDNWQAKPQPSARQLLASSALTSPIQSLVVATKSQHVVPALNMLKHRLNAHSTIVFVQNGFGLLDQVSQHVFADVNNRPTYISATTTHGLFRKQSNNSLSSVWSAVGELQFAVLPSKPCREAIAENALPPPSQLQNNPLIDLSDTTQPTLDHLPLHNPACAALRSTVQALLSCVSLHPSWLPYPVLRHKQLQKVVVNVCINSLTALLDVKNGKLLLSPQYRPLVAKVCQECEAIFRAQGLIPSGVLDHPLAAQTLFEKVLAVTESTAANISSTLADLRGPAEETELSAMNGYFSTSGRSLGIATPTIDLLSQLVQLRLDLIHANKASSSAKRKGKTHGHRRSSGGRHKQESNDQS